VKKEGFDVSVPYRPPICHGDFSRIVTAEDEFGRKVWGMLGKLNLTTIDNTACKILDVYLESVRVPNTLRSVFFDRTCLEGDGERKVVVASPGNDGLDANFPLPLECNLGQATQTIWTADTRLYFTLQNLKQLRGLRVQVERAGVTPAVLSHDIAVNQVFGYRDNAFAGPNNQMRFQIVLNAINGLAAAIQTAGPYRLALQRMNGEEIEEAAWTYFHVPARDDLQFLEEFANLRFLFKAGDMAHFNAAGNITKSFPGGDPYQQGTLHLSNDSHPATENSLYPLKADYDKVRNGWATLGIPAQYMHQNNTTILFQEGNGRYFADLSWGVTAIAARDANGDYDLVRLYLVGTRFLIRVIGNALNAYVPTGQANVAGLAYDTRSGNTQQIVSAWDYYDFPAGAIPLNRMITHGVSSCAATLTFPNQNTPDHFIFSHVDGNPLPPIEHAVQHLYGNMVGALNLGTPALKCINLMHPEIEEVRKYSQPRLFPALNGDPNLNIETVFCGRERHIWGISTGQFYRGYTAVGMTFPHGSASLVGVYGPMPPVLPRNCISRTNELQDCSARKILFDLKRGVYGSLPDLAAAHSLDNIGPWKDFVAKLREQMSNQMGTRPEPGTPRYVADTEVIKQRPIFVLPNAGTTLFNLLRNHVDTKPVADQNFIVISDANRDWLERR